jgi:hypothetical protein
VRSLRSIAVLIVSIAVLAAGCRPAVLARSSDGTIVCPEGAKVDEMGDACGHVIGCIGPDGKLEGPAAEMTEGTRSDGRYEHGLPTGTWRVTDPKTGRLLGAYTLDHGEGVERRWWPTGELLWEGRVHAGSPDGAWRFFAKDGTVTRTEEWKDGKLVREEGPPLCAELVDTMDKCPDQWSPTDLEDGCPDPDADGDGAITDATADSYAKLD